MSCAQTDCPLRRPHPMVHTCQVQRRYAAGLATVNMVLAVVQVVLGHPMIAIIWLGCSALQGFSFRLQTRTMRIWRQIPAPCPPGPCEVCGDDFPEREVV